MNKSDSDFFLTPAQKAAKKAEAEAAKAAELAAKKEREAFEEAARREAEAAAEREAAAKRQAEAKERWAAEQARLKADFAAVNAGRSVASLFTRVAAGAAVVDKAAEAAPTRDFTFSVDDEELDSNADAAVAAAAPTEATDALVGPSPSPICDWYETWPWEACAVARHVGGGGGGVGGASGGAAGGASAATRDGLCLARRPSRTLAPLPADEVRTTSLLDSPLVSFSSLKAAASVPASMPDAAADAASEFVPGDGMMLCDAAKPRTASAVCGNRASTAAMRRWLVKWAEDAKKGPAKKPAKKRKKKRKKKGSDSDLDDFMVDDSDDSDVDNLLDFVDEADEGSSVMLLSGPPGVGKTAAVYACAMELGYQVIEVNASQQRSGKAILSKFAEATQSHELNKWAGNAASAGGAGGGAAAPSVSNAFAALFGGKAASAPAAAEGKKAKEGKKKEEKKAAPGQAAAAAAALFGKKTRAAPPVPPADAKADVAADAKAADTKATDAKATDAKATDAKAAASSKATSASKAAASAKEVERSLILFEEVEVTCEEDRGFYASLVQLASDSKCPIVLTCNTIPEALAEVQLAYTHVPFERPTAEELLSLATSICTARGVAPQVTKSELSQLIEILGCDMRRIINALQAWPQPSAVAQGGEKTSTSGGRLEWLLGLSSRPCSAPLADVLTGRCDGGGGTMISLAVAVEDVWTTNGYAPLLEQPLRLLDAACDGALLGAEECAVAVSGAIPPAFTIAPPPPPPAPVEDPDEKLWEWERPKRGVVSGGGKRVREEAVEEDRGSTRGGSRLKLSLGRASKRVIEEDDEEEGPKAAASAGSEIASAMEEAGAPAAAQEDGAAAEPMEPMEVDGGADVAEAAAIDADAERDGVRVEVAAALAASAIAKGLAAAAYEYLPPATPWSVPEDPRHFEALATAKSEATKGVRGPTAEHALTELSAAMYTRLSDAALTLERHAEPMAWREVDVAGVARAAEIGSVVQALALRVASQQLDSSAGDSTATRADAALREPFARSLFLSPRDHALAAATRKEMTGTLMAILDHGMCGLPNACGTGRADSRHAHVDCVGAMRSMARLEQERRAFGKQRRFQHALGKYMLEEEEIAQIRPMHDAMRADA